MYIEVENEVTAGGGLKLSRLKCSREGKEWETVLPAASSRPLAVGKGGALPH